MSNNAIAKVAHAITNCFSEDASKYMVDALRAVESCDDSTRRIAIERIENRLAMGEASRSLVNLLVALRRI